MTTFTNHVCEYISSIIIGFEIGMYKMIMHNQNDRLNSLQDKHHPFITIFRDLHEAYYTKTFNSIIRQDDAYVTKTFDQFRKETNHSYQCLLNILANLTVAVHFNIDRKKLDSTSIQTYQKSLQNEINDTIDTIDLAKLLISHKCLGPIDSELREIPPGSKFIQIQLSTNFNNNENN